MQASSFQYTSAGKIEEDSETVKWLVFVCKRRPDFHWSSSTLTDVLQIFCVGLLPQAASSVPLWSYEGKGSHVSL